MSRDRKEIIAELCHKQWSGWIKYMFGKCLKKTDGTILIPEWVVTRWRRQAYTPYQKLSHKEKESDRTEADKFITLLKQQPTAGEETKKLRDFIKLYENEVPRRAEITFLIEACDCLDRAKARLKAMYSGDLSPESRLNGYKVVVDSLRKRRDELFVENKAKDEIIFAYESVHAPINPLLTINKDLLDACEKALEFIGRSNKTDWNNEITPILEAAIAKAEG